MIAADLQDTLADFIREKLSGCHYRCKTGEMVPVRVHKQYLPRPRELEVIDPDVDSELDIYSAEDFETNFPCVIVMYNETRDNEQPNASVMDFTLLVGTYDDRRDNQGYRDVLDIIERLRLRLLEERVLAKKFLLVPEVKSYLFNEQVWPLFFGGMDLRFETPRANMPTADNFVLR